MQLLTAERRRIFLVCVLIAIVGTLVDFAMQGPSRSWAEAMVTGAEIALVLAAILSLGIRSRGERSEAQPTSAARRRGLSVENALLLVITVSILALAFSIYTLSFNSENLPLSLLWTVAGCSTFVLLVVFGSLAWKRRAQRQS
jgi:hypothetical protein